MNRVVLIGNGFDLAHELPTSYKDFIDDYWLEWIKKLSNSDALSEQDEFYSFTIKRNEDLHRHPVIKNLISYRGDTIESYDGLTEQIKAASEYHGIKMSHGYNSQLFKDINKEYLEKWVDIENEYYRLLKQIYQTGTNKPYKTPIQLNTELKALENKLTTYLSRIQEKRIKPKLINEQIKNKILAPFDRNDISVGGEEAFIQFINGRLDDGTDERKAKHLLDRYGWNGHGSFMEWSDIKDYANEAMLENVNRYNYHKQRVFATHKSSIPYYFLLPEDILFLNFNYTSTASLYVPKLSGFRVNHIHGELNNPDNPIIFGYGDEMDEDYKKMENLNDNNYLQNVKSICYLKTDNYRKLLTFLDSAPYQIVIMGHSCGNSDRTLLNTLFEHKNCLSIKPYFHQKEDGSDNYIDIVQNISRDFNDMTLMRDRVVNKTYCEPLTAK